MEATLATHRTALVLSLTENGAEQLAQHPEFQPPGASTPKTQPLQSRYYDTDAYELSEAGYSLRVTRSGNMCLQTLESARTSSLAAGRDEWEWPLMDGQPNLSLLTTVLKPKLLPRSELREIFATDLRRVERTLELAPNSTIKISFDEGTINGAAAEPVRELALEILDGPAGALYHLALDLHAKTPLTMATESPALRGLRLISGRLPPSCKAAPIRLPAAASGAEAFHRLIVQCLNHLLVNQPAALAGGVEGVHQMRVAIRRLRALLRLYKPALDRLQLSHFDQELQRIGRIFGQARDWDVFCTELLPQANQPTDPVNLYDGLKAVAAQRRDEAHEAFIAGCRGRKFTATVLELAAWAEEGWNEPDRLGCAKLKQKLKNRAPRWLDRLARKVEARGQGISGANNAQLHKLRKSIKKLRYGIEFTESLWPRKKSRPYQKRCKALQDTLGLINDSSTSVALARTLRRDTQTDLRPAISALARYQKTQRESGLDELGKNWKAYRKEARFW
ncbi:MAG TPA: CHAD domain-containing protein [Acidocella sp.]|jgi:inorganic triphosphatase YgiF|nr:CHAD domain-containing protein [Acidocella sp.]